MDKYIIIERFSSGAMFIGEYYLSADDPLLVRLQRIEAERAELWRDHMPKYSIEITKQPKPEKTIEQLVASAERNSNSN